ncbi:M24 family metallopeptidase [Planctomicrobium sp. SH668]|uniref:M24 family metallopeptidase n=1 Tax=Planctomicrobium sp. SH668 TaxID=3448126 RepID=UPI003F5BD5E2
MSLTALAPDSPISSAEIPLVDGTRLEEIMRRHSQLSDYLRESGYESLLIRDPANYAWATCGGRNTRQGNSVPFATLMVTSDARVILTSNVDSGQIFDRDLMGLGFLLKERPWTEDFRVLCEDVSRGRKTLSDFDLAEADQVPDDFSAFRQQFSEYERTRIRELGRELAHAVEATARNFEHGATEAEIAGHLAHRLIKHEINPVQIQVMADRQGWRYRHWGYGPDRVERHCVISAVGMRRGLHAGTARTVSFGAPSEEMQAEHRLANVVLATGMFFTQAGWSISETWARVARIYEKFGIPNEWRCAEQAEVLGYSPHEISVMPNSKSNFQSGHAVFWHPSVKSTLVGDTILIRDENSEVITPSHNWPMISVEVKGDVIEQAGILIREIRR